MYEIYCDESRPESIFSERNGSNKFMIIGGVLMNNGHRKKVKNKIKYLKKIHGINKEFKWTGVSPAKIEFYIDIINFFFEDPEIRFRCIVVDTSKVDLEKYHDSDSELGFYKFYYQLLVKWIDGNQKYRIYLDDKQNKQHGRLSELTSILNRGSFGFVEQILPLRSNESVFIQLADLLSGAVSAKYNSTVSSQSKKRIIALIENKIDSDIGPTPFSQKKFNVFQIRLG